MVYIMLKHILYVSITVHLFLAVNGQVCKSRGSRASCTKACPQGSGCPAGSYCECDGNCGLSCVKKGLTCRSPPKVRNAKFTSTGNKFNDVTTYTCNDGFTLNGSPKKRCTAKGRWDGVGPTCMPACKVPDLPFGAYVKSMIKTAYATGERITLGCKTGFKLVGSGMRICIAGGWTVFPFECKATHSCPRTIRASRTKCSRKCSTFDGSGCGKTEKCLCDGQCGYSCVETGLSCGEPSSTKNGFMEFNSTGYNATVRYWCKDGFTLDDDKVKRCTAKKRWDKPAPNCLPDCSQPRIPSNAYIENKKVKYASGDRVMFKCKKGYNQEGIPSTLCFMGKWSIIPFKCEVGGCGDPGVPENGNKVGIWYGVNGEVFFSCNLGYIRIGSEQRRCLANNTWSGVQPICKIVDCGKVKPPLNGSIHGNETTFQKSITYKCDPGFELRGSKTVICRSDGQWSLESKCEVPASQKVPYVKSMIRRVYNQIFNGIRICMSGRWTALPFKCQGPDCVQPRIPSNAYIENKKVKYKSGDRVKFKCKKGYNQEGIPSSLCFMGKWTIIPLKCEGLTCRPPPKVRNAKFTSTGNKFNDVTTYKCNDGFTLNGSPKKRCTAKGRWDGVGLTCMPACKVPDLPFGAYVKSMIKTAYATGERMTLGCKTGFKQVGSGVRICIAGRWTVFPFECKGIEN